MKGQYTHHFPSWEHLAYEELASAIVHRAMLDYQRALIRLMRHPNNKRAVETRDECEDFFSSRFFSVLTDMDGNDLRLLLQEKAFARAARKRKCCVSP